jgi:hypothetical protein
MVLETLVRLGEKALERDCAEEAMAKAEQVAYPHLLSHPHEKTDSSASDSY